MRRMRRRSGYTLIELLVAMALIMMIMAVLSASFIVGLDTFSKLKALGDMSERLRSAVTLFRADLDADHHDGRIRVSDPIKVEKPREGFLRVRQFGIDLNGDGTPDVGSINEGQSDGITSYRGYGHVLHMAVKKRGNKPEDFFAASVPGGSPLLQPTTTFFNQLIDARHQDASTYRCQWAEVAYYLQPLKLANGTPWTANGTPLYSLHRLVKLAVVDNRAANAANIAVSNITSQGYREVSWRAEAAVAPATGSTMKFNSPTDLAYRDDTKLPPTYRGINLDNAALPDLVADIDTILLTDVVSFDIKLLRAPPIPAPAGQQPAPFGYPIGVTDFVDVPDFDTANTATGALAIQITLRVWDLKTKQTRQITLIQDL